MLKFWAIYLFFSFQSLLHSPDKMLSLFGHPLLKDGFLFWFSLGVFYLSNIRLTQKTLFFQILVFKIFIIVDFLFVLAGYHLCSHRGHDAIIQSMSFAFFLDKNLLMSAISFSADIILSERSPLFADIVIFIYFFRIPLYAYIFSLLPIFLVTRETFYQLDFFSGRLWLWQVATRAISLRFEWGWGYDNFCLAYAVSTASNFCLSFKAHNIFLDLLLAQGFYASIAYILLFLCGYMRSFNKIAISAYFISAYFWYDTQGIAFVVWWILSL